MPWSIAKISGCTLEEYTDVMKSFGKNIEPLDRENMTNYIHESGGRIIENKGATFYAVSVAVCRLCSILLSAYNSISTITSMLHGEYGISDVCLSVPTLIGPEGVRGKVPVKLTDEEIYKLQRSASILKKVIDNIEI